MCYRMSPVETEPHGSCPVSWSVHLVFRKFEGRIPERLVNKGQ